MSSFTFFMFAPSFVEFVDVIHEDVNIGFKQGERFSR